MHLLFLWVCDSQAMSISVYDPPNVYKLKDILCQSTPECFNRFSRTLTLTPVVKESHRNGKTVIVRNMIDLRTVFKLSFRDEKG